MKKLYRTGRNRRNRNRILFLLALWMTVSSLIICGIFAPAGATDAGTAGASVPAEEGLQQDDAAGSSSVMPSEASEDGNAQSSGTTEKAENPGQKASETGSGETAGAGAASGSETDSNVGIEIAAAAAENGNEGGSGTAAGSEGGTVPETVDGNEAVTSENGNETVTGSEAAAAVENDNQSENGTAPGHEGEAAPGAADESEAAAAENENGTGAGDDGEKALRSADENEAATIETENEGGNGTGAGDDGETVPGTADGSTVVTTVKADGKSESGTDAAETEEKEESAAAEAEAAGKAGPAEKVIVTVRTEDGTAEAVEETAAADNEDKNGSQSTVLSVLLDTDLLRGQEDEEVADSLGDEEVLSLTLGMAAGESDPPEPTATPTIPPVPGSAAIVETDGTLIEKPTKLPNDSASLEDKAKNAIQKAIDAALKTIDQQTKSITIQVEAGEYNGDISITKPKDQEISSDFRLDIVSTGAVKETTTVDGKTTTTWLATSDNSAKATGNINIDGINVLLAGIYLSLEKKISVKNADITVVGTTADDTVNLETDDETGKITVDTGDGKDTVTLETMDKAKDILIKTGDGDDSVTLTTSGSDEVGNVIVETGAGADKAVLNVNEGTVDSEGKAATEIRVSTEAGNDAVTLNTGENIKSVSVDTGLGNDNIILTTEEEISGAVTVTSTQVQPAAGNEDSAEEGTDDASVAAAAETDNDTVNITFNDRVGGDVSVTAGDGNNTVTLKIPGSENTETDNGGSSAANSGKANGDDEEKGDVGGKVTITAGKGNDNITLTIGKNKLVKGDISISTAEGKDTVALNVGKTPGGTVKVDLGAGDDTLSIARTGHLRMTAKDDTEPGMNKAITVLTGKGKDRVNLDIAVADEVSKIDITDGDEHDGKEGTTPLYDYHIHLTGKLDGKSEPADRIKVHKEKVGGQEKENLKIIEMMAATTTGNGNSLTLTTNSVEGRSLSDELENKPRVEIDLAKAATDKNLTVSGKTATYTAGGLFTDYVIVKTPTKGFDSIIVNSRKGMLNKLIIDAEEIQDDDGDHVQLGNVIAREMSLLVQGRSITVTGKIAAADMILQAASGTPGTEDGEEKKSPYGEDELNLGKIIKDADSAVKSSFNNVKHEAKIVLADDSAIYSGGDVNISAKISQTGGILNITNLTDALNLLNIKIGDALIIVNGGIYAGVDLDQVLDTTKPASESDIPTSTLKEKINITEQSLVKNKKSAISLDAEVAVKLTTGSEEDKYLSSFALGVVTPTAKVLLQQKSDLLANGNIQANAKINAEIVTEARAGGLPISLAVSGVASDAQVVAEGATVTSVKGDVTLEAVSKAKVTTTAEKGEGNKRTSGGFFAIDVVVQDATAQVINGAKITAGGNVNIHSTADAEVNTKATSAAPKDKEGGDNKPSTMDYVRNIVKLLLGNALEWMGDTERANKLTKGLRASSNEITLAPSYDKSQGEVTLSRTKANGPQASGGADGGESKGTAVKITAMPKDGYKVSEVRVVGLEPGKAVYTEYEVELTAPHEYTFDMPAVNVTVYVRFAPKDGNDAAEAADPVVQSPALFGEGNEDDEDEEEDEDWDISSLFDSAVGGLSEIPDDVAVANSTDEHKVKLTFRNSQAVQDAANAGDAPKPHGAILTYYDLQTKEVVQYAAPGQKVHILINPAKGSKMTDGSLKVKYTAADGEQEKTISPDAEGRYLFEVPDDITAAAGADPELIFSCTFEIDNASQAEQEQESGKASSQVTGALAVSVVENTNNTIIDNLNGTIIAAGKIDIAGTVSTVGKTEADGAGATLDDAEKNAASDANAKTEPERTNTYAKGAENAIKVKTSSGGTVTADTTQENKIIFKPTPDAGRKVKTVTATYTNVRGREMEATLEADANGNYTLIYDGDDQNVVPKEGTEINVSIEFTRGGDGSVQGQGDESHDKKEEYVEGIGNCLIISQSGEGTVTQISDNGKTHAQIFEFNVAKGTGSRTGIVSYKYTKVEEGKDKETEFIPLKNSLDKFEDGEYKLDLTKLEGLKPGTAITLNVDFAEDSRKLKITSQNSDTLKDLEDNRKVHGSVTVTEDGKDTPLEKVKTGMNILVKVKPENGYKLEEKPSHEPLLSLTYKLNGTDTLIDLTWDKDKNGYTGKIPDIIPEYANPELGVENILELNATFDSKGPKVETTVSGADGLKATPSLTYVEDGDSILLLLQADGTSHHPGDYEIKPLDEGGITGTAWTSSFGGKTPTEMEEVTFKFTKLDDGKYKIERTDEHKDEGFAFATLKLAINVQERPIKVNMAETKNGTITAPARASAGENLTATLTPSEGCFVVADSAKAIITNEDGEVLNTVKGTKNKDGTWSFAIPAGTDKDANIEVTAEFELGTDNKNTPPVSAGIGVGVAVVLSTNNALIKSGALEAGGG
ncbi:MAG: hypothetical protein K5922_06690, partial [Clostridiales bacterium]|nr:hypothetical protein [Clostridiales bacterium]